MNRPNTKLTRHTTAPPTLLVLPPEIRNIIFGMVLGAPSGCITLHRAEPETSDQLARLKIQTLETSKPEHPGVTGEDISFSFLRVCKQIYTDCRDMLWSRNTFVFNALDLWVDVMTQTMLYEHKSSDLPYRRIVHLELYTNLGQDGVAKYFYMLADWVNQGAALNSLVMKIAHEGVFGTRAYGSASEAFSKLALLGETVEAVQTIFPDDVTAGLRQVDRKLVITQTFEDYLRELYRGLVGFEEVIYEMQKAIGGEMRLGEKL